MRACLYVLFLFSLAHPTLADVWVKGYHNSNGDYVKGHWRSSPPILANRFEVQTHVQNTIPNEVPNYEASIAETARRFPEYSV
mgnify:CR=1 FL=1